MFEARAFYRRLDAEPMADGGDFAEGDAGLHHAERPRVHAQEDDLLLGIPEFLQVRFVRRPRVIERVIDMGDRRPELEPIDLPRQFARGGDELPAGCR